MGTWALDVSYVRLRNMFKRYDPAHNSRSRVSDDSAPVKVVALSTSVIERVICYGVSTLLKFNGRPARSCARLLR